MACIHDLLVLQFLLAPMIVSADFLMKKKHTDNRHMWVVHTGGTTCIRITAGILENINCLPPAATTAKDCIQETLPQALPFSHLHNSVAKMQVKSNESHHIMCLGS